MSSAEMTGARDRNADESSSMETAMLTWPPLDELSLDKPVSAAHHPPVSRVTPAPPPSPVGRARSVGAPVFGLLLLGGIAAGEAVVIIRGLIAPLPPVRVERVEGLVSGPVPPASAPLDAPVPTSGSALDVRSEPGALVYVDGEKKGVAPAVIRGLAPGRHNVRVVGRNGSAEQSIALDATSTTLLLPIAAASTKVGWVEMETPVDLAVIADGQIIGSSAQRRLQLPAGSHQLELVNDVVGVRTLASVTVQDGKATRLSPKLPSGFLNVNAEPWAEVLIDGQSVGTTPMANVPVTVGTREVVFRHPDLPEQRRMVLVTTHETARVSVNLKP